MQTGNALTDAILHGGQYGILRHFSGQDEALARVTETFFEGLERLAGPAVMSRVKDAGLCRIHEFVSPEELPELKRFVNNRVKQTIHALAGQVGREALGLSEEFWVSDLVITRIHYPFSSRTTKTNSHAVKGANSSTGDGAAATPLVRLQRRVENGRAAWQKFSRLFSVPIALTNVRPLARELANWAQFRSTLGRYKYTPASGLETAAVHGPHLDIWNGLPYDGITLWWAIDGVTEEGGLLVYPDLFHTIMPRWCETKIGQAAIGLEYPPPHKIALNSGELLLFSHDHMYHASHTNVSPLTRIAISTHLCTTTPVFSRDTRFAFEHYFSSEDLARGIFRTRRFEFGQHAVDDAVRRPPSPSAIARATMVRPPGALAAGAPLRVCRPDALPNDRKLLACFDDTAVIVARSAGELFCVDSVCPHRGHNLIHGALDGGRLLCPGHGVAFDLRDGSSRCDALKLRVYDAFEQDGAIWVRQARAATAARAEPAASAAAPV